MLFDPDGFESPVDIPSVAVTTDEGEVNSLGQEVIKHRDPFEGPQLVQNIICMDAVLAPGVGAVSGAGLEEHVPPEEVHELPSMAGVFELRFISGRTEFFSTRFLLIFLQLAIPEAQTAQAEGNIKCLCLVGGILMAITIAVCWIWVEFEHVHIVVVIIGIGR
jgi:hypothetical protein